MVRKAILLGLAGIVAACGSEPPPEVVEQIIVRERGAPEPSQEDAAETPTAQSE